MLSCDEIQQLAGAICATAETLGQTVSANAAQMIAEDLAEYDVDTIATALRACRRELTGKLTLATILQRVQSADGHPDPNEAWSIALTASDESDTVVMTEEIQLAMAASTPVLANGDKVGARMAFLSAYQRFVDAARKDGKTAKWRTSLGTDPQRRVAAVEEAGRLGRLPAPEVREQLSRLTHEPITQDGAAIAGLVTGRTAKPSEKTRQKLQEIKASVQKSTAEREADRKAESERHRARFEARRAEQLQALEELKAVKP